DSDRCMQNGHERRYSRFEWAWHAGRAMQHVAGVVLRYLCLIENDVVTAGAGQPQGMPRFFDAPLISRNDEPPRQRGVIRHNGLASFEDHAVADNPLSVLAAAREWPTPAHPIAAGDLLGPARGRADSDHDRIRTLAINLVVDGPGKPGADDLRDGRVRRHP